MFCFFFFETVGVILWNQQRSRFPSLLGAPYPMTRDTSILLSGGGLRYTLSLTSSSVILLRPFMVGRFGRTFTLGTYIIRTVNVFCCFLCNNDCEQYV